MKQKGELISPSQHYKESGSNAKNTMLCPIKVNSDTIELIVHISCYCVLDLLSVKRFESEFW